ncbi:hypothetical protein BGZ94_002605, partial [Podila epigama]
MPVANRTGSLPSVGPSFSPLAPLTPNGPDIVNCMLQAHNDGEQSTIFEAPRDNISEGPSFLETSNPFQCESPKGSGDGNKKSLGLPPRTELMPTPERKALRTTRERGPSTFANTFSPLASPTLSTCSPLRVVAIPSVAARKQKVPLVQEIPDVDEAT